MADELKKRLDDSRPTYEPPRALRLGDTHPGMGDCQSPGTSADYCDSSGNDANTCFASGSAPAVDCYQPGSGAGSCGVPGNDAPTQCYEPGNTPD